MQEALGPLGIDLPEIGPADRTPTIDRGDMENDVDVAGHAVEGPGFPQVTAVDRHPQGFESGSWSAGADQRSNLRAPLYQPATDLLSEESGCAGYQQPLTHEPHRP
jgi:hypothetical protein